MSVKETVNTTVRRRVRFSAQSLTPSGLSTTGNCKGSLGRRLPRLIFGRRCWMRSGVAVELLVRSFLRRGKILSGERDGPHSGVPARASPLSVCLVEQNAETGLDPSSLCDTA